MLAVPTETVIFTSGATESNNIAILGTAAGQGSAMGHIVTTAIEHSSVLAPIRELEKRGFEVTYVYPDPVSHSVRAEDVVAAVRDDTVLLSMMSVNNETGAMLPLRETISEVRRKNGKTVIHCDATQSFGKMPFPLHSYPVDLVSASSHKIHGPKGVGFLYVRDGIAMEPHKYGGAQEKGVNPGTENVPGICGFGVAAENAMLHMSEHGEYVGKLKNHLKSLLSDYDEVFFNESPNDSPYILNFSIKGVESANFVDFCSLNNVFVSAGSACSRGARSYVLENSGFEAWRVEGAVRVGLSHLNSREDMDGFVSVLAKFLSRKFSD